IASYPGSRESTLGSKSSFNAQALFDSCSLMVNGSWSAWNSTSSCTQITTSYRECNNPSPDNGGTACVVSNSQTVVTAVDCNPVVTTNYTSSPSPSSILTPSFVGVAVVAVISVICNVVIGAVLCLRRRLKEPPSNNFISLNPTN